jgi:hypothetical protein
LDISSSFFPTITRCRERKKFLFNGLVLSWDGLCSREMRWIINREDGKKYSAFIGWVLGWDASIDFLFKAIFRAHTS